MYAARHKAAFFSMTLRCQEQRRVFDGACSRWMLNTAPKLQETAQLGMYVRKACTLQGRKPQQTAPDGCAAGWLRSSATGAAPLPAGEMARLPTPSMTPSAGLKLPKVRPPEKPGGGCARKSVVQILVTPYSKQE